MTTNTLNVFTTTDKTRPQSDGWYFAEVVADTGLESERTLFATGFERSPVIANAKAYRWVKENRGLAGAA